MGNVSFAVQATLAGLQLAGEYVLRRRRPFIINHLPTVRCNLACPFCYVSGPDQQAFNRERYPRSAELSSGELRDLYRQLADNGFRIAVIVGGEPLLRDDLDDMLGAARGRIYCSVFSNGQALVERAELIRRAASLFVSLDAPDEQHDLLRGRPGNFRRALEGIDLVRRRFPTVRVAVNMTITRGNVGRVPEMIAFGRELGLPISFQPPSYEGQFDLDDRPSTDSATHTPGAEEVARAFREIRAASARGERIIGTRAFFDLIIADRRTYPCHYPTYVLGPVLPNGDVLGCTSTRIIANLKETTVREVVSGRLFAENARAGLACARGCRDWGIHDLSAIYNRQFGLPDARRYQRSFL
jgi:MoaA/NifB/PqqE/SkfB family radical SAM enzyme